AVARLRRGAVYRERQRAAADGRALAVRPARRGLDVPRWCARRPARPDVRCHRQRAGRAGATATAVTADPDSVAVPPQIAQSISPPQSIAVDYRKLIPKGISYEPA